MLRSEIVGHVNMKSCLSGMPTLKLGLNDKIFFEMSGRSKIIISNNFSYEIEDHRNGRPKVPSMRGYE